MKIFGLILLSLLSVAFLWLTTKAYPFQSTEEFILKLRLNYKTIESYYQDNKTEQQQQLAFYQARLYGQLTVQTEQQLERQLDAHVAVVELMSPIDQDSSAYYLQQAKALVHNSTISPNSASFLVTKAQILLQDNQQTEAMHLFQLAHQKFDSHDTISRKHGIALEKLCSFYWHNGELAKALDLCKQSLEWSQGSDLATAMNKATSLHNLAVVEQRLGHAETAIQLFQQAIEQRQSSSTALSLEQANHLQGLASSYADLSEFKQAEWALIEALEITAQVLPPNDSRLTQIVLNISENLAAQGEYKTAYKYSKQALKLASTDPDYAKTDLGILYHQLASRAQDLYLLSEAEEYYHSALKILRSAHGGDHQDIATLLNNLGSFYSDNNEVEKAKIHHEQGLAMRLSLYGQQHPDVAMSQNNLALVLDHLGDTDGAQELLEQALSTSRQLMGSSHLKVSIIEVNLARIYHDLGDNRAESLLKTALVNQQNMLGSKHPKLLPTLLGLADYYKDQDKLLDAEQLYQRALAIAQTSLPPEHPDLAYCLYKVARLYHLKHDYANAELFYQKELRILRHNKSPDDEIQGTIKRLIEVLIASGKTAEAQKFQQKL